MGKIIHKREQEEYLQKSKDQPPSKPHPRLYIEGKLKRKARMKYLLIFFSDFLPFIRDQYKLLQSFKSNKKISSNSKQWRIWNKKEIKSIKQDHNNYQKSRTCQQRWRKEGTWKGDKMRRMLHFHARKHNG